MTPRLDKRHLYSRTTAPKQFTAPCFANWGPGRAKKSWVGELRGYYPAQRVSSGGRADVCKWSLTMPLSLYLEVLKPRASKRRHGSCHDLLCDQLSAYHLLTESAQCSSETMPMPDPLLFHSIAASIFRP